MKTWDELTYADVEWSGRCPSSEPCPDSELPPTLPAIPRPPRVPTFDPPAGVAVEEIRYDEHDASARALEYAGRPPPLGRAYAGLNYYELGALCEARQALMDAAERLGLK